VYPALSTVLLAYWLAISDARAEMRFGEHVQVRWGWGKKDHSRGCGRRVVVGSSKA
jgi:hypothetical protein